MTHELTSNMSRIVEAVLHLITLAARRGEKVTQYDIVKSLFLADLDHLNRYGRPVTFDNYAALNHGPVPRQAYNLLKEDMWAMRKVGGNLPWQRRSAPELGRNCNAFENPCREVNEDILSPSDMKALERALEKVKKLRFAEIRRLTHEHPAYIDAWCDDPVRKSFPIDYSKLFDKPDPGRVKELAFLSEHL